MATIKEVQAMLDEFPDGYFVTIDLEIKRHSSGGSGKRVVELRGYILRSGDWNEGKHVVGATVAEVVTALRGLVDDDDAKPVDPNAIEVPA
jgi:hypothetical protein